jgi:hypothetical protein
MFGSACGSLAAWAAQGIMKATRRDFEREIIVPLEGGLGFQMWRYAVGRAASLASGLPVRYDLSFFESEAGDQEWIGEAFPEILLQTAPSAAARLYRRFFFTGDADGGPAVYDGTLLASKHPRYMGGRYQNFSYIESQAVACREEFAFKPVMTDEARFMFSGIYMEELPVAVHLAPGAVSERYFRTAVRVMSERLAPAKPVFFVFSGKDKPDADILADTGAEFVYADENDGKEAMDMYLMSRCKHFIISDALLSWWPAWLSRETPDKIVIMPDKWPYGIQRDAAGAMALPGWTVLSGE